MSRNESAIAARQLCRHFRRSSPRVVHAIEDVSFEIPRGSFVALTGPSGSGKTSLLSLLGLLDRPTSGKVIFAGRDMSGCSDFELARCRRRMGFVFQDFALLPRLSVLDNLVYPLIPRGGDPKQRQQIAQQWLDRLGLAAQAASRPTELSGGECQRVALARALAGDPEIVLADEPSSSLDRESSQSVLSALHELHLAGKTLVLSTHDAELLALATHIVQLREGRIVSSSP